MSVTAKLSNYRQSPRKVRLVANLVKGKKVEDALVHVNTLDKRAAPAIAKLIKSAVANAKALGMDTAELRVTELRVDKGVVLKRSMPRAMGRAFPIHKHSSHISVVLDVKGSKKSGATTEVSATEKKEAPAKKTAAKTTTAKKVATKTTKKTK